jgi:hypothetical protein
MNLLTLITALCLRDQACITDVSQCVNKYDMPTEWHVTACFEARSMCDLHLLKRSKPSLQKLVLRHNWRVYPTTTDPL